MYTDIVKSGRLIPANGAFEAYGKICTGRYVYFEADDFIEAMKFSQCEHIVIGPSYYVTGISSGVVRGFKYKRSIDLG